MNRDAMLRSLAPAAAFLLAACSPFAGSPAEEAPLAGADIGGPFELTGEDGHPVRWEDFEGRYRTLYFGYTYCPDICPTDVQRAMAGLKRFEQDHPARGAKVQPLFISVDPARDTPAVLREFTDAFHPRLIGMTGEVPTLERVARDFGTSFSKGADEGNGAYLVNHLGYTYLFGPDGKPITTLPTDRGSAAVAEELAKWVH